MNVSKVILILTAALLVCSTLLFQTMPASASDNVTVSVIVEQNVTVEQGAAPHLLPPPTPPVPPTPPAPPAPPAPPPPAPPAPAPIRKCFPEYNCCYPYYSCSPYYPGYSLPYIYRWSTYISPSVIVVEQPQVQTQLDPPPVINSFTADPSYIQPGQTVVLTWTVSDVLERNVNVTISPGIGSVPSSGSFNVSPSYTTTYTLTATNIDGSVSASTTVTVTPHVAAFTASSGSEIASSSQSNILTSGLNSDNVFGVNSWLLYVLLIGLLVAAAAAVIVLLVRKPATAYAGGHTGTRTGYLPWTGTGTETGTQRTTPAAGAKFMTSDGEYVPISGNAGALGRSDFRSMVKPGKADLISRQHIRVDCENGEYYIEDRNSTNGTKINESGITGKGRQLLRDGDVIELADALILTFKA